MDSGTTHKERVGEQHQPNDGGGRQHHQQKEEGEQHHPREENSTKRSEQLAVSWPRSAFGEITCHRGGRLAKGMQAFIEAAEIPLPPRFSKGRVGASIQTDPTEGEASVVCDAADNDIASASFSWIASSRRQH